MCILQTREVANACGGDYATAARTEGHRIFVAKIEEAKECGALPIAVDAQAVARFYIAVVQGMSVQAIDGATHAQLDALVDMALMSWPGRRT